MTACHERAASECAEVKDSKRCEAGAAHCGSRCSGEKQFAAGCPLCFCVAQPTGQLRSDVLGVHVGIDGA
jgi:hypothetical protein